LGGVVHLETTHRTRLLGHLPKQINHKNQRLLNLEWHARCCSDAVSTLIVHPELLSWEAEGDEVEQSCKYILRNGNADYFATRTEPLYKSIQTIEVSPGVEISFIWNWPLTHIRRKVQPSREAFLPVKTGVSKSRYFSISILTKNSQF